MVCPWLPMALIRSPDRFEMGYRAQPLAPVEAVEDNPPRPAPAVASNLPLSEFRRDREAVGTMEQAGEGLLAMKPARDGEIGSASVNTEALSAPELEPAAKQPGAGLLAAAQQDAESPTDSEDASAPVETPGKPEWEFAPAAKSKSADLESLRSRILRLDQG